MMKFKGIIHCNKIDQALNCVHARSETHQNFTLMAQNVSATKQLPNTSDTDQHTIRQLCMYTHYK